MSMIKLLHDYVLVSPDVEDVTRGGIIIPDTAKQKPTRGKVITVGPGKKDEPMLLKEKDIIYFGKYNGTEIKIDDQDYMLLRQSDVYCVIE